MNKPGLLVNGVHLGEWVAHHKSSTGETLVGTLGTRAAEGFTWGPKGFMPLGRRIGPWYDADQYPAWPRNDDAS